MLNLLYFLSRFGGTLAFIVLEILALFLVVRYNQNQRDIWINSSRFYSGVVHERADRVRSFTSLARVADSLAVENAELYDRLYDQLALAPGDASVDSLLSPFDFIPARIIKNSINKPTNNLTLNRGTRDGIAPGMGVVVHQGVLGIVRSVSPHFCRVMSVLNTQTYIGAAIQRTGAFGTLNWDAVDPTRLILADIPKHLDVQPGDTVLTSGHSAIFPPGIPIGLVDTVLIPSGSNTFRIPVQLWADLGRTSRAYIIRNRFWEELESLETEEIQ